MERDLLRALQVGVGLLVLLIVAVLYAWLFPTTEGNAAWVQAAGDILGITAAIVIPTRIHLASQQDAIRQKNNARDLMVGSLLAEIGVLSKGFEEAIGHRLSAEKDVSGYVDRYWPPERPFSVYDGCVGRIAEIEPALFRDQFIVTYASMNGLLNCMRMNRLARKRMIEEGLRNETTLNLRKENPQSQTAVLTAFHSFMRHQGELQNVAEMGQKFSADTSRPRLMWRNSIPLRKKMDTQRSK